MEYRPLSGRVQNNRNGLLEQVRLTKRLITPKSNRMQSTKDISQSNENLAQHKSYESIEHFPLPEQKKEKKPAVPW
jgi:hypothetical protein